MTKAGSVSLCILTVLSIQELLAIRDVTRDHNVEVALIDPQQYTDILLLIIREISLVSVN